MIRVIQRLRTNYLQMQIKKVLHHVKTKEQETRLENTLILYNYHWIFILTVN